MLSDDEDEPVNEFFLTRNSSGPVDNALIRARGRISSLQKNIQLDRLAR